MKTGPVREPRMVIDDSGVRNYVNRILIATPATGLVRMEWVMARYGQIIPMNWSNVQMVEWLSGYVPMRYQLMDAQNLICKEMVIGDYEWCLLIEQDNVLPPDCFVRLNQYMREAKVPVVSGLYFSKSRPSEPLVFRGRGVGAFTKFKKGDLVWCDGVPTGCLLIHHSIIKALWNESPEYVIKKGDGSSHVTRRVFNKPEKVWFDPSTMEFNTLSGTTDLEWCTRVMKDGIFAKAGWPDIQRKKWPFLVDTNIFVRHVDMDGTVYP